MRLVSLLASATEIVCALGLEDQLVGRSHECDYPESVRRLPRCTSPRFDTTGTSADIDRQVKESLRSGPSVYAVDAAQLDELQPDVIVTQAQCEVCAVSLRDVEAAAIRMTTQPRIVSLNPNALADVWDDFRAVAAACGVADRGEALVADCHRRIRTITDRVAVCPRPTVACIEWIDPLMAAGNWMPELVDRAGGVNLFGEAGKHSPWMTWEDLLAKDPEVIVVMPCGFDLPRTKAELPALTSRRGWSELRAVRTGRVWAADGNAYFNRPGPRLVEALEMLTAVLHPETVRFGHAGIERL